MPHQCTDCGRAFADGSKEMLSGCPDCGGNKFQFRPDGVDSPDQDPDPDAEPPEPPEPAADGVTRAVGSAATAVRDLVSSDPPDPATESGPEPNASGTDRADPTPAADPDPNPGTNPDPTPADASTGDSGETTAEDAAQASARTDVVPMEDLPSDRASPPDTEDHPTPVLDDHSETAKHAEPTTSAEPTRDDRPDLADLREELNDQFESIRVLEPGQYELNLMELYDREEYIIALQEDGKYTIQVPERWKDA